MAERRREENVARMFNTMIQSTIKSPYYLLPMSYVLCEVKSDYN